MTKSTDSIQALIEQREAIDAQIASARAAKRADAAATARQLIADYGLSANEVGLGGKAGKAAKGGKGGKGSGTRGRRKGTAASGVAAFRDPASGKTWTGWGRAPAWIMGKDRAAFKI